MSSASVEGVQPSGPLREPPVTKAPAGHRRSHLGLEPAPRVTYKGSEKQGGVDVEKRERASPRAAVIRSASGDGRRPRGRAGLGAGGDPAPRSEEHTSELQSLMRISYAVFCLKKKKHEEKYISQS